MFGFVVLMGALLAGPSPLLHACLAVAQTAIPPVGYTALCPYANYLGLPLLRRAINPTII